MQNRILFHNGKSLEVPVIQGGMGVGISLSSLAGAVTVSYTHLTLPTT